MADERRFTILGVPAPIKKPGIGPLGENPIQTVKAWLPTMPLANRMLNPPLPKWLSTKVVNIGKK